jgi:hypothetical protein
LARFALMSYSLNLDFYAIESTTISAMIASLLFCIVLNLVIEYFRTFSMKNEKTNTLGLYKQNNLLCKLQASE